MKTIRVIIAGSRGFDDYDSLMKICNHILRNRNNETSIEIVSGTARGADTLGERYAKENGFALKRMPADWNQYGKRAGYIRNSQMAEYASKADKSILIAFWDGESLGTGHMIDIAKYVDLQTYVVNYKTHEITCIKPTKERTYDENEKE